MTRSRRDVVVAIAFATLALVFLYEGRNLPFAARGIPGPGLFPFLLAIAILCFSAGLLVIAFRRPRSAPQHIEPSAVDLTPTAVADESGLAPESEEPSSLLRPLALWLLVLVVCLSLPFIGFVPAMLVLTVALTVGMERRRDLLSLAGAVAVPLFFYFLFATLLEVRLPLGPFG